MARGVNKVILVGNLGSDPDVKYMPSGAAVANISLATTDSWKDKNSGEQQDRTEWHRVVFFNRLAEIVRDYLKKGSQIYVEGRLQTRKWQDKQGIDRYTTEVIGKEMQMLGSANSSQQNYSAHNNQSAGRNPTSSAGPSQGYKSGDSGKSHRPKEVYPEPEFDDDVPF